MSAIFRNTSSKRRGASCALHAAAVREAAHRAAVFVAGRRYRELAGLEANGALSIGSSPNSTISARCVVETWTNGAVSAAT